MRRAVCLPRRSLWVTFLSLFRFLRHYVLILPAAFQKKNSPRRSSGLRAISLREESDNRAIGKMIQERSTFNTFSECPFYSLHTWIRDSNVARAKAPSKRKKKRKVRKCRIISFFQKKTLFLDGISIPRFHTDKRIISPFVRRLI